MRARVRLALLGLTLATCGAGPGDRGRSPVVPVDPAGAAAITGADAHGLEALEGCGKTAPYVAAWDAEEPLAARCGQLPGWPADLARVLDSAAALDGPTVAHVRDVFARGASLGRRPDVFGLVGDSVTLEPQFMTPFGAGAPYRVVLSPAVRDALLLPAAADGGSSRSVLDVFRGVRAYGALDSFRAPRAARTGARATWALQPDPATGVTPIDSMVRALSPAFAVVLYGTNDAELFVEPLDRLAARFTANLGALVTALERRGIVPILTTVPGHARAYGLPDCDAAPGARSNARLMIQTGAASDAVIALARDRRVPLVDYRRALESLVNHGISADGVHPTFYPRRLGGGGVLDEAGLQCGYNVRNLVTLRMLALVRKAIEMP